MNGENRELNLSVNRFCAQMGQDPFWVQGAGGNVSSKDSEVMWIKASGTCLAQAMQKNIFVPVNFKKMSEALLQDEYSFTPQVMGDSPLRPSIEVLLHGLMSNRIVVHLHLISALIHLVKTDAKNIISNLVGDAFAWGYIDYCKPGLELAGAVSTLLKTRNNLDVIFLGNHGVVIGADTVEKASELLRLLDKLMGRDFLIKEKPTKTHEVKGQMVIGGFQWCSNPILNSLAIDDNYLKWVLDAWALFPDHVVFLGEKALIVDGLNDLNNISLKQLTKEPFIFVRNVGVLQSDLVSSAQLEQLLCYHNVISNLDSRVSVKCLSLHEIAGLLNWDAEVYRQSMSKQ